MTRIAVRPYSVRTAEMLSQQGLHPVMARIFAARGISDARELSLELTELLPPSSLLNTDKAALLLADAIAAAKKICIVADYDCDGATACAVGMLGLRAMGGDVSFLVPNRFTDGYGLTPAIVDEVRQKHAADVIVTVDNGIASIDGVKAALALGMDVLVTDHHLPGDLLPANCVIVNPNHPHCDFSSKHLAGVGVIFYVMLALRALLRERGIFDEKTQPRLDRLLDLVALGTVADVVRLDKNNRILVAQGLKRIRAGQMQAGITALFRAAGRQWQRASTFDLGFTVAPRLNAAGRMSDMALGVECLTTDDPGRAWAIAEELNAINQERREMENAMREEALAMLADFQPATQASICILDETWHQGIVGILASRLKDAYFRPVFVFAPDKDGLIRGSGRSIPGFHLRDAIDLVAKRYPDMIVRFGGHAMAAGLTMHADAWETFIETFEAIAQEQLTRSHLERVIETDGAPDDSCYTLPFVQQMEAQIWGQGFEQPVFSENFRVISQRIVKEKHLSMQLERKGQSFSAIYFNCAALLPQDIHIAFRIASNEYNGITSLQLIVEYAESA